MSDMISVIKPVLRHRIIPNFNAEAEGIKSDDILNNLLESVK
jgi:MoxR-like ATPase